MAVVNLQLSSLTMEQLPAAYDYIIQAFCERKTILNAFALDVSYDQDYWNFTDGYGFLARHQPNLAMSMNALMYMVMRLSRSFIDTDAAYIAGSYSNFPKSYTKAVKSDTNHNVGTSIPQYDSFALSTIEDWKKVLTNAAYWLNQFTKIRVPDSYCSTFQRCRRRTNSWQNTPYWGSFQVSEDEEYSDPMTFSLAYNSTESFTILEEGETEEEYYGSCTGSGRMGLAIDNRTPYSAVVKLYLCMPSVAETNWSSASKWPVMSYEMKICGNEWYPDPSDQNVVYPGEQTRTKRTMVEAGSDWKPKEEEVEVTKYSMGRDSGSDNYQISSETDQVNKNYSHDGSLEIVTLSSHEAEGVDYDNTYKARPTNILDFTVGTDSLWDGLGIWSSPSEPIEAETLPARTKKRITATNFTSMPMATTELSTMIPADWDRGDQNWKEELHSEYNLRVVPVLDFTDSITTFSIS